MKRPSTINRPARRKVDSDVLPILKLAGELYETLIAGAQGEAPFRWGVDR